MTISEVSQRIVVALCALSSGVVAASPGDLDLTFNGVGFATDSLPGSAFGADVTIHSSGEIVTASDYSSGPVLWRRLPDGSLDSRFGGTGRVLPPAPADYQGIVETVAIDSQDRIVLVGRVSMGYIVYRFNFDGSADLGFGVSGSTTVPIGGLPTALPPGLAIQPDNKIVGVGGNPGPLSRFIVYRLDQSGQLDPTFGGSGLVFTEISPGGGADAAVGVAIQTDGKIVASGRARGLAPGAHFQFALARYLPTGALDPDFGNGGTVVISIVEDDLGRDVHIQADGKIVVTGIPTRGNYAYFGAARLDDRGVLDPTFGGTGTVYTDVAAGLGGVSGASFGSALQPDNSIVLAGSVTYNDRGVSNTVLIRYLPNGLLDSSFGENGFSETNWGYWQNAGLRVALQADGQILVGGGTGRVGLVLPITARYQR